MTGKKNPPVSGGRQSQFPDDDSCFEVLLCPLNLPQEHRKNNSDDGTGCAFVGPRTRTQTNATWSGLRPDTPPTPQGTRKNSASRSPFSDEKVCCFDPFALLNARNRSRIAFVHSYAGS